MFVQPGESRWRTRVPMRAETEARVKVIARTAVTLTLASTVLVLAACSGLTDGDEQGTRPPTSTSETATPTAPPEVPPTFTADGTAEENLAVFAWAGQSAVDRAGGDTTAQLLVGELIAAGFVASQLEFTADTTAAGFQADSLFVAARIDAECLIGQAQGARFTAIISTVLSNERCLVGLAAQSGPANSP